MRIVTGFRQKKTAVWNGMIENLMLSGRRFGYDVHVYDLPVQDDWLSAQYELSLTLCWKYKVVFMQELLNKTADDLLWIDGDCLIVDAIDFNTVMRDCDLAFTLRDIEDRHKTNDKKQDGYINSGVFFIKNTAASRRFMNDVRRELLLSIYDQEAFNKVLLRYSLMERHGEVINAGGAMVKMLNCREYNNFYLDQDMSGSRILHFKSKGRSIYSSRVKDGVYIV